MTGHPRSSDSSALHAALVHWIEDGIESPLLVAARSEHPGRVARLEALVRELLASLAEARLPEPSASERASARRALASVRAEERAGGVRTLLARIVEPARQPALQMRATSSHAAFQAAFELDGFDLDLAISQGGDLLGQILPRDPDQPGFEGGVAELQLADGTLSAVEVEEDGEFRFAPAPSGSVRLVLQRPDLVVVVENVDLPTR